MSTVKKYHNDHGPVPKDEIISALIPDTVTECALMLQLPADVPCSSSAGIATIANAVSASGKSPHDVIEAAKIATGCITERCVVERVGDKHEIETRFKLVGPNGIELLSNYDIDATLRQWTARFRDFYPYNFNMSNYAEYSIVDGRVLHKPDTLATVNFEDLYARGFRCGGCVINTDVYQGKGKHWMALFFDARNDTWSVEFFNSGGNGPGPEWINWLLKTEEQMHAVIKQLRVERRRAFSSAREQWHAPTVQVHRASSIRHQHSKTECGLYSLFYIYARLSGVPCEYFHTTPIPDQHMFELRQHLFIDSGKGQPGVVGARFSFDEFARKIRIEWE